MQKRAELYVSTSYIAILFYWNQKQSDAINNMDKEKIMATYHLALFSIISDIVFKQPEPAGLKKFGIISDIVLPKQNDAVIEGVGYVRPMKLHDIVSGSQAKPGWCGFFASDGAIVFWESTFVSSEWYVGKKSVFFQRYIH